VKAHKGVVAVMCYTREWHKQPLPTGSALKTLPVGWHSEIRQIPLAMPLGRKCWSVVVIFQPWTPSLWQCKCCPWSVTTMALLIYKKWYWWVIMHSLHEVHGENTLCVGHAHLFVCTSQPDRCNHHDNHGKMLQSVPWWCGCVETETENQVVICCTKSDTVMDKWKMQSFGESYYS
jgi:hypothetical protein